ncbi:uncharacterized protein LOC108628002 [Ceratina calcarata]|uniref:Uncharacterized protein LOC108628002 n=1 Tax=Ceratina calcarata TaxID=156304 RepID=A0AAJ7J6A1_9HYME|nr:uncharacterized protein LOC108628002 [Ceratina calcarata]
MDTYTDTEELEDNLIQLRTIETQNKLIDQVERRTAIWDPRKKNHVNRMVLDIYWKDIGEAIGKTGKEARRMWRSLRQEFKKQLDREKVSRGDGTSSDSFESTWPFFKRLQFLKDQGKSQKIESVPPVVCISDDSEIDEPFLQNETATDIAITRPAKKLKMEEDKSESEEGKLVLRYNVEDDDMCFFISLLPHVKTLPLNKQFEFRVETQKLLYELTFNKNIYEIPREESEEPTATHRVDTNTNLY